MTIKNERIKRLIKLFSIFIAPNHQITDEIKIFKGCDKSSPWIGERIIRGLSVCARMGNWKKIKTREKGMKIVDT